MSIAGIVTKALEQNGMSQVELANTIGVSKSYVSHICSGRRTPTLETLFRISTCLGIPMERFVKDSGEHPVSDGQVTMTMSREELHLLLRYRKMGRGDQKLVNALVKRIAGEPAAIRQKPIQESPQEGKIGE